MATMVPVSANSKAVAVQTNVSITKKDQEDDEKTITDLSCKVKVNQVDLTDLFSNSSDDAYITFYIV
jgi:hypothetical protein